MGGGKVRPARQRSTIWLPLVGLGSLGRERCESWSPIARSLTHSSHPARRLTHLFTPRSAWTARLSRRLARRPPLTLCSHPHSHTLFTPRSAWTARLSRRLANSLGAPPSRPLPPLPGSATTASETTVAAIGSGSGSGEASLQALYDAYCLLDARRLAAQTGLMDASGRRLRQGSSLVVSLGPEAGSIRLQGEGRGGGGVGASRQRLRQGSALVVSLRPEAGSIRLQGEVRGGGEAVEAGLFPGGTVVVSLGPEAGSALLSGLLMRLTLSQFGLEGE